jgi:hypothetical protein
MCKAHLYWLSPAMSSLACCGHGQQCAQVRAGRWWGYLRASPADCSSLINSEEHRLLIRIYALYTAREKQGRNTSDTSSAPS